MGDEDAQSHPEPRGSVPWWRQVLLSMYWLSKSTESAACLVILLPIQVLNMVGEDTKASYLGVVVLLGAIGSGISSPIFGHISDLSTNRFGRRRPFIVIGYIFSSLSTIGLAFSWGPQTLWVLLVCWGVNQISSSIGIAAYSALIPDVIPSSQRGAASGWMGLMTMLGYFFGAGVFGFIVDEIGITVIYFIIIILNLVCMIATLLAFKEPPNTHSHGGFDWKHFFIGMIAPFKSANFRWVFFTRFMIVMGTYSVQEFLQYYFADVIGQPYEIFGWTLKSPAAATGLFTLLLLVGAVIASVPAGRLSDRFGRKVVIYVSCTLQIIPVVLFTFMHDFVANVFMGVIFGLGYGAYAAVEWSLASDTLPSVKDHARDMALWHIALSVPQAVATPIGGAILDALQEVGTEKNIPNLGYIALFVIATIYFVLGTVFVYRIKIALPGQKTHEREQAMELTSDFERLRDDSVPVSDEKDSEAKSDRAIAMTVY